MIILHAIIYNALKYCIHYIHMSVFEYLLLRTSKYYGHVIGFLATRSFYHGCHMVPVHNCISHDQAGLELSCSGLPIGSVMN